MAEGPGPSQRRGPRGWTDIRLVLSGGNALAAYQGGAYEALHESGLQPGFVAATSMGAVNGALIAATPPELRVQALRALWNSLIVPGPPAWNDATGRSAKRLAAAATRMLGHAHIMAPSLPRLSEWMPGGARGIYVMDGLRTTVERCVDFTALRQSSCRLVIHATDLATGEPVPFRSWEGEIGPLQIQASSALPPDGAPVAVHGRLLGDGGLCANLPVKLALTPLPRTDTLCIAVDLFDPQSTRLDTLDDLHQRRQDLLLGNQSRQAIELIRARHELARARGERVGRLVVAHLVYPGTADEIGEKLFDYTAASIGGRWRAGYSQMRALLERLDNVTSAEPITVLAA